MSWFGPTDSRQISSVGRGVGQVPEIADRFQDRPGVDLAGWFATGGQAGTVTRTSPTSAPGRGPGSKQYKINDWLPCPGVVLPGLVGCLDPA